MSKQDKHLDRLMRRVRNGTASAEQRREYIKAGPHVRKVSKQELVAIRERNRRKPRHNAQ